MGALVGLFSNPMLIVALVAGLFGLFEMGKTTYYKHEVAVKETEILEANNKKEEYKKALEQANAETIKANAIIADQNKQISDWQTKQSSLTQIILNKVNGISSNYAKASGEIPKGLNDTTVPKDCRGALDWLIGKIGSQK